MARISTFIPPDTTGRRLNAAGKRIHHKPNEGGVRGFIGIDGEGITVKGEHRYVLLGIGDQYITDSLGITWDQAFEFMYDNYTKYRAMCGFFLGYDFNQLFKTLPEDRARMLLTNEGRAKRQSRGKNPMPFPVRYKNWEFDMLGMKRLKLRPKCDCVYLPGEPLCKCPKKPWLFVCDTGPFFQQSLLAVLNPKNWKDPIVTPEEYAIIQEGKSKRSSATKIDGDMIRYNQLENEILSRVLNELDKGFREMGVLLPPSKWFGPGQVAQEWLRSNGVRRTVDLFESIGITSAGTNNTPQTISQMKKVIRLQNCGSSLFWEAAKESYFGGWFELMMHGYIPGITYEYDINSAYPYIIKSLPCLEHGTFTYGSGIPIVNEGEYCLVRARVWAKSNLNGRTNKKVYIGPMPHRDHNGQIYRPIVTEGWYWWHELQASIAAKCMLPFPKNPQSDLHSQCFEWIKYTPCNCPPPMEKVESLYLLRQKVGKDTPLGKGAKTGYNSMYGKFAQSIGHPIFGNPIYASLITAGCRTMILNAIATHPIGKKDVVMVATDAVYFRSPHPSLPISEELGEWGFKEKHNLTTFKPGVYWDDNARMAIKQGVKPEFKARGFSAKDFAEQIEKIDEEFRNWNGNPPPITNPDRQDDWPSVTFPTSFSMVSCIQALRRGKWHLAGYIDSGENTQRSNPHMKRKGVYYDAEYGVYRTEPIPHWLDVNDDGIEYQNCLSTPYEKKFGLEDPFSWESKEESGITPDGIMGDLISNALKAANGD